MKGIVRGICGLALVVAVLSPASGGAFEARAKTIEFTDDGPSGGTFEPKSLTTSLASGPEGKWKPAAGSVVAHNVVEASKLFASAEEIEGEYSVELSAGAYPYYCTFHGRPGRGMHGTISVKPTVKKPGGGKAKVTWADADSDSGNRFDVDWRAKGSKKWEHWKKGTSASKATFGSGGKPTAVKPSKTYEVRVRSFDSKKKSRRSDWSPSVKP